MEVRTKVERKFLSIQAVIEDRGVALIAIADDGTAWTARSHCSGGHLGADDLEWLQITPLPAREGTKNMWAGI